MALNIKSPDVERLVNAVATLTGESKTQAIRRALEERMEKLSFRVVHRDRSGSLMRFLETEVWPQVPRRMTGRRLSRAEKERILGYGPKGV